MPQSRINLISTSLIEVFKLNKALAHTLFPLGLLLCLLFSTCKKIENAGIGNSSFTVLGDQTDIKLLDILATEDDGFIVATHSSRFGNQKIWISKYDKNMLFLWERFLGGSYDSRMDKIFIDRDENILVAGYAYGFGQDTLGLNKARHWVPFNHLLSSGGATKWEKKQTSFPTNRDTLEKVTNIFQDSKGNYLVGGNFLYDRKFNPTMNFFPFATINQYKPDGELHGQLIFNERSSNAKIDAIFETEYHIIAFGHKLSGSSDSIEVFETDKDFFMESIDYYQNMGGIEWPQVLGRFNSRVADLQYHSSDNKMMYYSVFANDIYRFGYDENNLSVFADKMESDLVNVKWAGETKDGFLYIQQDGNIIETDYELNQTIKFQSEFGVQMACKLKGSGYVAGLEKGKYIYLILYDPSGKIIAHD